MVIVLSAILINCVFKQTEKFRDTFLRTRVLYAVWEHLPYWSKSCAYCFNKQLVAKNENEALQLQYRYK